ncbi:PD-(D/E)XK nuclease family protein [Pseudomonas syringae]|uniref:PDDEXK-like family protein n=1 Tax=Pseudomonas syringae TaxID=317 RepID=UPI003F837B32
MEPTELYAFLRDPKLLELMELNKTVDDVFEVTTLLENQNSEVLAWCMNPHEGHCQGDGVIKDFLEAAHSASDGCTHDNRKFFAKWTPGKIRTSSFGAAFVTREFSIKVDEGTANGRLDLFLVAIENKVKASLTVQQLEKYMRAVRCQISNRKVFADYDLAFIVLDQYLESYKERQLLALGKRWALLDYRWLEASASRARFQLGRGNNSAQLLIAYCQSVTQWQSPASEKISDLAANLVLTHPAVVSAMRSSKYKPLNQWIPATVQGHLGELTLFAAQHNHVCEKLLSVRGVASLVPLLLKAIPTLSTELVDQGIQWISITPPETQGLMRDEGWPVYVTIYRVAKASKPSAPKYNVRLVWDKNEFDVDKVSENTLRLHLSKSFAGLEKFASSQMRRILLAEHVTPIQAIDSAAKIMKLLSAQIANCPGLD